MALDPMAMMMNSMSPATAYQPTPSSYGVTGALPGFGTPGVAQPSFDASSLQMLVGSLLQMLQTTQSGMPMLPSFGGMGAMNPMDAMNGFLGGGGGGGGGTVSGGRPRRRRTAEGSSGGGRGNSGGGSPSVGGGSGVGNNGGSSSAGSSSGVSAGLNSNEVKGLTFDQAAALVKKGGGQVNPGGRPTVLALRSDTSASSQYKDVFVVLKPDGTLEQFDASTRPTSNGQDRAMLKPGSYDITPRWRDGKYNNDAFLVQKNGSNTVGVGRDSNGDGKWSQQEMNAGTTSDLIRLHRGNSNSTSSTGCLNVKNYDGFLKAVGGRDADFNLVIVNQK